MRIAAAVSAVVVTAAVDPDPVVPTVAPDRRLLGMVRECRNDRDGGAKRALDEMHI